MQSVKSLIEENSKRYNHFLYYLTLIEKAENNVITHPDIAIESCKALIEGIAKSILKEMDQSYHSPTIDKKDLRPLVRDALLIFAKYDADIENDIINQCIKLVECIGSFRNERGDISHGKHAPKDKSSDSRLSRLVLNITEGLIFYVLTIFYAIDLSYKEKIRYEDNAEFNEIFNLENTVELINYSRAIYDQDYDYYVELLSDWQSENEERAL